MALRCWMLAAVLAGVDVAVHSSVLVEPPAATELLLVVEALSQEQQPQQGVAASTGSSGGGPIASVPMVVREWEGVLGELCPGLAVVLSAPNTDGDTRFLSLKLLCDILTEVRPCCRCSIHLCQHARIS